MLDSQTAAHEFLYSLSPTEKDQLLNVLIGLDHSHMLNNNASFYSYRNIKKLFKSRRSEIMQSFRFVNDHNDEIIITQLKDHSFLKNSYRIEIFYNLVEYDYRLIMDLLHELKRSFYVESYA
ncbi:hypothetical protein NRIC_24280 [Enterococcus florum]|uniref:Uncharacterized protein n=1 Tax=Enterococcus florum TaxID=2480627 RepID=A0A4P5P914_9ENTE|nr:hypothetical protein [Enterococcus florum]GCF94537.1 hypothetical protein NRIC_24280 [Enterococcus florum]